MQATQFVARQEMIQEAKDILNALILEYERGDCINHDQMEEKCLQTFTTSLQGYNNV